MRFSLVSRFVSVTSAAGITAPVASVTVPQTELKTVCAAEGSAEINASSRTFRETKRGFPIQQPQFDSGGLRCQDPYGTCSPTQTRGSMLKGLPPPFHK